MDDIQNESDDRGIPINQVGVTNLRYPITVLDRENEKQETIAEIEMSVSLHSDVRGTHMSRFITVLNAHHEMTMLTLPVFLQDLKEKLCSNNARIKITFPYFLNKKAPESGSCSVMDYNCTFIAESNFEKDDFIMEVAVPVTSLCPCSKAISDFGAHNQRGVITISVRPDKNGGKLEMIWIEELISIAERSASSPVYPILKRNDERHVTMAAYEKPVFVEDMVRNVFEYLQNDLRIKWFHIGAINYESIHNHSAFANVTWRRNH